MAEFELYPNASESEVEQLRRRIAELEQENGDIRAFMSSSAISRLREVSELNEKIDALTAENQRLRADGERVQARLNWAANELLACDYGDNDAPADQIEQVGWVVYGWRNRGENIPKCRIYGRSIDLAIDSVIDAARGGK